MRVWKRAKLSLHCGSCSADIRGPRPEVPGDVMLEIQIGDSRRVRCVACAVRLFGEQPPAELVEDKLPAPQKPSKPPEFVTAGQLAAGREVDFRRRQAGESE